MENAMKPIHASKILKNLKCLKTDRLILRRLKVSDAADVYEYARNPRVSKYTMWRAHKSPKESQLYSSAEEGLYEGQEQADIYHLQGAADIFQGVGSIAGDLGGAYAKYQGTAPATDNGLF